MYLETPNISLDNIWMCNIDLVRKSLIDIIELTFIFYKYDLTVQYLKFSIKKNIYVLLN